ncbi:dihydrofolate reductase family protein [Streptomyces sp. NPDC008137]|uniref:dihydrofolate reductase family protein n=1 Tax=Streptomyces sp. NPDC008137 TaxID=3364813 RepID=UPI0036EC1BE3
MARTPYAHGLLDPAARSPDPGSGSGTGPGPLLALALVRRHRRHDPLLPLGRRALGLEELPNKRFDTFIQGRASYDLALKEGITCPYPHLREYVASCSLQEPPDPNVEIIADDLVGRVRELKSEEGEFGIYLCGGSKIAGELLDEIDELVIKTYPLVYGSGMPMFGAGFAISEFTLESVRAFDNGVLVRSYSRKR